MNKETGKMKTKSGNSRCYDMCNGGIVLDRKVIGPSQRGVSLKKDRGLVVCNWSDYLRSKSQRSKIVSSCMARLQTA